jgi:CheY-like chemotaxis protein
MSRRTCSGWFKAAASRGSGLGLREFPYVRGVFSAIAKACAWSKIEGLPKNMTAEQPTILITDDDDGHAFLIEENLRLSGLRSIFLRFSDGEEVLQFLQGLTTDPAFQRGKPYVLLLDIRMPKIDGIEVLRQIKSHPALRTLPVIMLTTANSPQEVERCHALSCNNYIQKPVSWDSFASTIGRLGEFITLLQIPRAGALT